MVDTHAHLAICEPTEAELVAAARESGVNRILTVGLDEASNREALRAAGEHEEVFASIGRHPNSATGFDAVAAADIESLASDPGVRAVGETGLDYYREAASRDEQLEAFEAQIAIARNSGRALVVHLREGGATGSRGATDEAFAMLRQLAEGVTVVLHCFSAATRVAEAADQGWYCSFAGNVTYPKAEALREAAASLPEELLLVETDAPFLAPQPMRGRPNAPANVVATARALAEARDLTYDQLEQAVEANARRAFAW